MRLFKRKKEESSESLAKVGIVSKLARQKILSQAKDAISKSYKQGRLKFEHNSDMVEYTDKDGKTKMLTLDDCAVVFWEKMNNEMMGSMGGMTGANLGTLKIFPDDIKQIILGVR